MNPWTLLLDVLGRTLAFFYSLVPNYGMAIILLTVVVNILLFPLTLKQTRSMKAMQEIQPEVKKLQQQYKSDREELQRQLMALYQERGVNPAAGCLPLILQMPIWFALFSVLRVSGDNLTPDSPIPIDSALGQALMQGQTTFLGMDLSISPNTAFQQSAVDAIPYIILVLVVTVSGFLQQWQISRKRQDDPNKKQERTPAQGAQQALKFMPILFGVLSWNFVTGLVVYFAASNIFRIGQQALMTWLDERQAGGTSGNGAKPAPPPPDEDTGSERRGPSPHASKKRNKRRRK